MDSGYYIPEKDMQSFYRILEKIEMDCMRRDQPAEKSAVDDVLVATLAYTEDFADTQSSDIDPPN